MGKLPRGVCVTKVRDPYRDQEAVGPIVDLEAGAIVGDQNTKFV